MGSLRSSWLRSAVGFAVIASGGASRAGTITSTWLVAADGNWFIPANWSTNPVAPANGMSPVETYHAVIDALGPSYTVELDAPVTLSQLTIGSASATLLHTAGRLTLESDSSVSDGRYVLQGGTLDGSGHLLVSDSMDWLGGSLSGAGQLEIGTTGLLAISGAGSKTLERSIVTAGASTWTSSNIQFNGVSAVWRNEGMFSASAPSFAVNTAMSLAPGALFDNAGVFAKTGGGDVRFLSGTRFDNNGRVDALGGRLSLLGSGAHSGAFVVASGASLEFAGSHALLEDSSLAGDGSVRVSGGVLEHSGSTHLDGAFSALNSSVRFYAGAQIGSLSVSGTSEVVFSSAAQVRSISIVSGSARFDSILSLDAGANLSLSGSGTLSYGANAPSFATLHLSGGLLSGFGDISIGDSFIWSSGLFFGKGQVQVAPTGAATLSGSLRRLDRALVLEGSTTQVSGETSIRDGAWIENRGHFQINSGSITALGDGRVLNFGEFESGDSALLTVSAPFDNHGTVSAGGDLALAGGGQHDGSFVVAAGASLRFRGVQALSAATSITGDGDVWIDATEMVHAGAVDIGGLLLVLNAANSQFGGPVNAGRFTLRHGTISTIAFDDTACFAGNSAIEDGTLTGAGDVVFGGLLDWSRGSMNGAGSTMITEDGLLRMSAPLGFARTLARTLVINGTTQWTVGRLLLDDGRIENHGEFLTSTDAALELGGPGGAGGVFLNHGEIIKDGIGSLKFGESGGPIALENFGIVEVRDGVLQLLGAATTTNHGTYSIERSAMLEVDGDFINTSTAELAFTVGGAKDRGLSGVMTITGDAALAGALAISTPETFVGAWGERWTVLTFATLSSDFDTFDLPETTDETLRWYAQTDGVSYDVGVSHIADIDHDGLIGFADLNVIASNFNAFGAWSEGDVDGDGFVGFSDLNLVVSLFNTSAPRNVPAPGTGLLFVLVGAHASFRRGLTGARRS